MPTRKSSNPPNAIAAELDSKSRNEPQSRLQVRAPEDRLTDALFERYTAGEITIDQAVDELKKIQLDIAKTYMLEDEYRDYEEFLLAQDEWPHLDHLRKQGR